MAKCIAYLQTLAEIEDLLEGERKPLPLIYRTRSSHESSLGPSEVQENELRADVNIKPSGTSDRNEMESGA